MDYLCSILPLLPHDAGVWGKRLLNFFNQKRCVLRPVLIEGNEYGKHLSFVKDWKGKKINKKHLDIFDNMFKRGKIWMIELSVPELYSTNKRKIGEILLEAEKPAGTVRDFNNFILARLPGYFVSLNNITGGIPGFSFTRSIVKNHVQLFGCEKQGNKREVFP